MRVDDFEFGAAVLPGQDPHELIAHAQNAEQLGYSRFWVPDQAFLPDPFLLLSRIAQRVSLDLGIALTSPFSRHPMQVARAMATVCHLDEGQRSWVLGLGRGNSNLVLGPLGLDERATSRRLVSAIGLVKQLLRGEIVEAPADGFFTSPVALELEPVDCAVFVGTRGPQTLSAAGSVADGFITESLFVPELVRWVREKFEDEALLRPHVAWQSVVVLDPGQPIPESARHITAILMRTTAPSVLELLQVDPRVRALVASRTLAPSDVTDDHVRRFIAIGTPEQLHKTVLDAIGAGVTSWSSIFLGERHEVATTMRRFAEEVITPIRSML
jgi:5,10-methylenetetrahydromethanopterin reductase